MVSITGTAKSAIGNIRNYGLKAGTLNWLGSAHRQFTTKYMPKHAEKIISKRKGECGECNKCCEQSKEKCKYLKKGLCSIYEYRKTYGKENCIYAPFPLELKSKIPKWKECKLYYE